MWLHFAVHCTQRAGYKTALAAFSLFPLLSSLFPLPLECRWARWYAPNMMWDEAGVTTALALADELAANGRLKHAVALLKGMSDALHGDHAVRARLSLATLALRLKAHRLAADTLALAKGALSMPPKIKYWYKALLARVEWAKGGPRAALGVLEPALAEAVDEGGEAERWVGYLRYHTVATMLQLAHRGQGDLLGKAADIIEDSEGTLPLLSRVHAALCGGAGPIEPSPRPKIAMKRVAPGVEVEARDDGVWYPAKVVRTTGGRSKIVVAWDGEGSEGVVGRADTVLRGAETPWELLDIPVEHDVHPSLGVLARAAQMADGEHRMRATALLSAAVEGEAAPTAAGTAGHIGCKVLLAMLSACRLDVAKAVILLHEVTRLVDTTPSAVRFKELVHLAAALPVLLGGYPLQALHHLERAVSSPTPVVSIAAHCARVCMAAHLEQLDGAGHRLRTAWKELHHALPATTPPPVVPLVHYSTIVAASGGVASPPSHTSLLHTSHSPAMRAHAASLDDTADYSTACKTASMVHELLVVFDCIKKAPDIALSSPALSPTAIEVSRGTVPLSSVGARALAQLAVWDLPNTPAK
eukprot:Sspe_Gene.104391::Locus_80558_Transcript_1_1_Confidence_1.000_Length_1963::g.104391::m.104391